MAEAHPDFSIIIPTRNRPRQIDECLQALAELEYPRDSFEVIVVDDGSSKSPAAIVERFQSQLNLMLLTQANGGPSAARNAGASRAKGKFFAFTDDDCVPKRDWLKTLAARFALTPDHLIGGRTLNGLVRNAYSATSQLIVDIVYAYYNADASNPRFFASNNLALPAKLYREVGGFDSRFRTAEDRELCDRWRHHQLPMTYAQEVIVYHAHVLTAGSFLEQHFGYGRGAFLFHQVRRQRGSGHFAEELAFYRSEERRVGKECRVRWSSVA